MAKQPRFEEPAISAVPELSYPRNPKSDRSLLEKTREWKAQKRVKCAHKDCCYPLNVVKQQGNLVQVETEDGPAYTAICSWDRRHMSQDGSPQTIPHAVLFPKPEEEEE